jgi:hypothetical protein
MKKTVIKLIPFLLILVSIGLLLSACDTGNQSAFRQYKIENNLGKFSLEYPRSYSDVRGPNGDSSYCAVYFKMPEKGVEVNNPDPDNQGSHSVTMYYTPAFIEIFITPAKGYTAKIAIDEAVQAKKGEPGYSLIARSQIEISGINAEFAHVTDSWMVPVRATSGEQPLKHYLWAYFDYNGLIWEILCEADSEEIQHAQSDFEHVIQNFKILD